MSKRVGFIFRVVLAGLFCFHFHVLNGQELAPLDLSDASFEKSSEPLAGTWYFYWETFLSDTTETFTDPFQVKLPDDWYSTTEAELPAVGYGSYSQRIILPEKTGHLGLYISHIFSSYRLIINGQVLYESGTVAKTADTYKPYREPKVIALPTFETDTLNVLIEVANFDHYNAGMRYVLELGDYQFLQQNLERKQGVNLFLAGGFFITGFILLVFAIAYRQLNIQVTFYALFSLSLMYRMLGAFPYPLHNIISDYSFHLATRLEYFTIHTAVMFGGLFIFTLYPKQSNVWLKRLFLVINPVYGMIVLFAAPIYFTKTMQLFVIFILVYLFIFIYIIIRARIEKEMSSGYLVFALLMVLCYTLIEALGFFGIYTVPNWVTVLTISLIIVSCNVALFRSFMLKIKLTEQALSETSLQQSRQTMLSLISHEIKTPVAMLQMNIDMLSEIQKKEAEPHPIKQKIVSKSLSAINDIKLMLNDFMYFMSAKSNSDDLLTGTDFKDFIDEHFDLPVHLHLEHPHIKFRTSRVTLRYVLQTLVNNANKYSLEGTPSPEFHLLQKGKFLVIELRDFGKGMSEEQLKKLGHLNLKINDKQEVSGIGFYLAKQLTERLGHQIKAEVRNDGTSVFIKLTNND